MIREQQPPRNLEQASRELRQMAREALASPTLSDIPCATLMIGHVEFISQRGRQHAPGD